MTKFNVHLYREMRLEFHGIEADTPEAAAAIAHGKPSGDADDIEDCNGEDLSALIDVVGDEDFSQSVSIDFEAERVRNAARKLLASLKALLPYAEGEAYSLDKLKDSPEAQTEAERAWEAIAAAQATIADAESAGISPPRDDIDVHALLAERRQIAVIWSMEDVQGVRPDLSNEQCWEVIEHVGRKHDAGLGITWLTLEMAAEWLFGESPDTDEAEEA